MKYLIRLDRFFAWVLFAGMLLYFISGYGMTKGFIDYSLAAKLHLNILTYFIVIAFVIHPLFAIHLAFKRWRIWNIGTAFLLFAFFALFFGSFVYVDRYYQPKAQSNIGSASPTTNNNTNSRVVSNGNDEADDEEGVVSTNVNQNTNVLNTNNSSVTATVKTFTLTELAKYNGKNGNPSYVAVDGNVYDLSAIFINGQHFSHFAGKELTNFFYVRHAKSALAKYPIVGTLVN